MSRHYKPGESDDLDAFRPSPELSTRTPHAPLAEVDDDPADDLDDLEDLDAPETDDDRAGVL